MGDKVRRHDVDWLRAFAMVAMFFFHCARFFDSEGWHVKNGRLSDGTGVLVAFISQWLMPLFFVLSATGIYHALAFRSNGAFFGERVKRLLVPFVFGTFVLIPPQVYIERFSHLQYQGSFVSFLPRYFDGWYGFGGNFAWMGLHLWCLEFLFVFSLLCLPLFRWLRRERAAELLARLGTVLAAPGAILLLALPTAAMELLVNLQPGGIGRRDFGGWSLLTYMVFFLTGYIVAADARLQESMRKHRTMVLVLGMASFVAACTLAWSGYSSRSPAFSCLRAFNSWCWLIAFLGFGRQHLDFNHPWLRYATEAVLPFYALHQTVIVVAAFSLLDWQTGVATKFLALAVVSFASIAVMYEIAVRRVGVLRFLFGMKTRTAP